MNRSWLSFETIDDFPESGDERIFYEVLSTKTTYVWDSNTLSYQIYKTNSGGGGGSLSQLFLSVLLKEVSTNKATFPTYEDTESTKLILDASFYNPLATSLKCTYSVAVSHNKTPNRLVYVALFNRTTNSFVLNSEFSIVIPTANDIVIGTSAELILTPNNVYEVLFARDGSQGNPVVTIYNAQINLEVL